MDDLLDEMRLARENAKAESPQDPVYMAQLNDMAVTLREANKATMDARRNVKKNPMLVPGAFNTAQDLFEVFACKAVVLPQRDSNVKAVLSDLAMSLKYMVCDYENHPEGREVNDCPIAPRILNEILDLPGDKCPIGP